ncbi:MAG: hypothetical protein WKF58_15340 [Ilumatobacteraceae bacterium]
MRIVAELLGFGSGPVLLTRTDEAQRKAVVAVHGDAIQAGGSLLWRPRTQRASRRCS